MKRSRPLSLFLSVLILISFFTVSVSAADFENLIDSDLRNWLDITDISGSGNDELNPISVTYYSRPNVYRLTALGTESGAFLGAILDDTSLINGHSYSLQFVLPTAEYLTANGYSINDASLKWHYHSAIFTVGVGFLQSNGEFFFEENINLQFNEDNILDNLGKVCNISFTAENYTGIPCVAINILNIDNQNLTRYFFIQDVTLIDNTKADDEGFFARLFEWFQEKFDAIGESFTNLGNKLTELKNSFLDSLSNLGDTIGSFFDEQLEGIKDFFRGFGNLILYFNWEGEYTNPFEREDSPIDKVSEFFDNLIEYVDSIGTSIENVLDSITGGLHIFDEFTSRFPWLKGIAVFCLALIVITRFIGL